MRSNTGFCFPQKAFSSRTPRQILPLRAAEQFRVDYREDGSALLTLGEKERYLLLDREAEIPADAEGLTLIRIPVERVYAASSSVPDLFLHCGALDRIRFTSTAESSWRLPELQEAMQKERLLYAGKYNAPDYELLLEENCDLVIENTMILHKPEVKEKLEALGLPVIIEYSSYEPEPLGRVEWIRLYGLLTGHQAEADVFFQEQREVLERTVSEAPTGKTAAFFHIASNGAAVVRRNSDYVKAAKMANAHEFICKTPDGYNTYVGEKGYSLSGGERQRIAIARAILTNPRLLILDEATASLDTESEFMIQKALERLTNGKTTFAIAHRLSTLKAANRIMVIDGHRIAEIGTHEELLLNKGIYYNLYKAQVS